VDRRAGIASAAGAAGRALAVQHTGDFFKGRSWGYGQAVHDSGAFGWDGGFGSSWLVDPANDLTAIVLTQRMFETPEPPRVRRDIQAAAYAGLV
jgi:CubicO group peptidase (beta-lactamase class C family)